MADAYTKVVLTVIAVMLTVIAVREVRAFAGYGAVDVRIVEIKARCQGEERPLDGSAMPGSAMPVYLCEKDWDIIRVATPEWFGF